jgi:hypothetical protein
MISIRSAISRSILGGRSSRNSNPNASAAFLQANVPFPTSSSDRTNNDKTAVSMYMSASAFTSNGVAVRYLSSPAFRRHQLKQKDNRKIVRGHKPSIGAFQQGIQVPTKKVAHDMGTTFMEMENEPLQIIAEIGNHKARAEVLRRHIMCVDDIEWEPAGTKLQKIAAKNREGMSLVVLPYQIGIALALIGGIGAVPMVFSVDLAMAFNESMVTMEVPMPSDLDTRLETGAWTWSWMEPVLGTASFTLLAFQYARQQLLNLGLKPFTQILLAKRAKNLCNAFPEYDEGLLNSFVESDPMIR